MPVGIGYDVHRFEPGRPLVLGGVELSSDVGLLGHSDADVATHAIMDALLGAAGLGDIGRLFPPSDPQYAGANSLDLLRVVTQLLGDHAWRVGNVDVTIVAERPRIAPAAAEMRRRLGEAAGVDPARLNVKATTNEGLGFLGRAEGIAAIAIAEILPARPSPDDSPSLPGSTRDD